MFIPFYIPFLSCSFAIHILCLIYAFSGLYISSDFKKKFIAYSFHNVDLHLVWFFSFCMVSCAIISYGIMYCEQSLYTGNLNLNDQQERSACLKLPEGKRFRVPLFRASSS